jgi:primary-amine oxidase
MVKGIAYDNINQIPNGENIYGTLLSENVIGVIHDHYITFHLDMEIDGSDNSFVKVNIKKEQTSAGESPRKSYLKAVRNVAKTEKDAQIKLKLYDPSEFHVTNPSKKTQVGNRLDIRWFPVPRRLACLILMTLPRSEVLPQTTRYGSLPIIGVSSGSVGCSFTRAKGIEDTLATKADNFNMTRHEISGIGSILNGFGS